MQTTCHATHLVRELQAYIPEGMSGADIAVTLNQLLKAACTQKTREVRSSGMSITYSHCINLGGESNSYMLKVTFTADLQGAKTSAYFEAAMFTLSELSGLVDNFN